MDITSLRYIEVDKIQNLIDIFVLNFDGSRQYNFVVNEVIRMSQGVLLTYDITSRTSFDNTVKQLKTLNTIKEQQVEKSLPITLVGNKCDLGDGKEREVERSGGEKLAAELGLICGFREISAKTGEGVVELFVDMIREIQELEAKKEQDDKEVKEDDNSKHAKKSGKGVFHKLMKKVIRSE
ncbi:P-loop containing nucleoside triphosphate hydrolase protein [Xylogone sp. PMI_703]|nr:P-loop containing nucleoside triphosphate hydrolase protein [Xylogone sp. PMI_703]